MAKGTEAEYASAAHLLRRIPLLRDHLFGGALTIDWDAVLQKQTMLSDGERVLVAVASSLFTGRDSMTASGPAAWIEWLDDDSFRAVLEAVAMRKGIALDVREVVESDG